MALAADPREPGALGVAARAYPAANTAQATRAARDMMSDTDFGWRGWSIAEARAARATAPLFLYQFDNPPPGPDGKRTQGAVHSDELGYVWDNNDPDHRWPAADRALSRTIQSYWVNFARTGNPNAPGLPRWQAYARARTALWFSNGQIAGRPPLRVDQLGQLDLLLQEKR